MTLSLWRKLQNTSVGISPTVQKTVAVGVTPEGSEAFPSGPKYHLNFGGGTSEGRGSLLKITEQLVSERFSPAQPGLEPEAEIVTSSMLTVESNSCLILWIFFQSMTQF